MQLYLITFYSDFTPYLEPTIKGTQLRYRLVRAIDEVDADNKLRHHIEKSGACEDSIRIRIMETAETIE